MSSPRVWRAAIGACVIVLSLCAVVRANDGPVRFVDPVEVEAWESSAHVLDARTFSDYLTSHMPGAVHLDDDALRATRAGLPATLHETSALASIFGGAGVDLDERVLVYATREDPLSATLVAYALTTLGHADVAILTGGFEAWAANHPVTREYPDVEATTIEPREATLPSIAFAEFEDGLGTDALTFVDARPRAHYLGDVPVWRRNGHIPGAHSLHWRTLTEPDNPSRLLQPEEIRERVDALGVSRWDDIVVYCGTGREVTLLMIALHCEIGYRGVRIYEGSWTEYCSTGAPVEVGERVETTTRVFRDGEVFISGQPTERTLRDLADDGVMTVVSCRTGLEMNGVSFDEPALVDELGLRYAHIPMGGHDGYTPAQVEAFARVLESADGPVYLHCASGGRARSLWLAYLVEHRNVSPDEAWARVKNIGGEPWSFERLLGRSVLGIDDGE